jgi:nitrite reductase (NADH) small subunit
MGTERRHVIGSAADVPPGGRLIVDVDGRSIGVFNVAGRFYALHNRCPHKRGALCEGPITGTVLPTTGRDFPYGREGEIVRCARHGWEFEIATGQAIADPRVRARTFRVEVDGSDLVVVM